MSRRRPATELDSRFGVPTAQPTPWVDVVQVLEEAELYWLSTVRHDGRPHVAPLVGVWHQDAFYFTTGLTEQKARNLEQRQQVAITTGINSWANGLDVVVEGNAVRVTDQTSLHQLVSAYDSKYEAQWHFDVGEDSFIAGRQKSAVFQVAPVKVLAFAKDPHAQTRYRFGARR